MKNKAAAVFISLAIACAPICSCGKKEEARNVEQAKDWQVETTNEGKTPPPRPVPLKADIAIVVPGPIKAKYKSVLMGVGDKKTGKVVKFTVAIGGGTAKVPGTDFTLTAYEYLPTWALRGKTITSRDDDQRDPAVHAVITQGGKKVFDGFIFQKHKTPSFVTDNNAIGLLGAE